MPLLSEGRGHRFESPPEAPFFHHARNKTGHFRPPAHRLLADSRSAILWPECAEVARKGDVQEPMREQPGSTVGFAGGFDFHMEGCSGGLAAACRCRCERWLEPSWKVSLAAASTALGGS